MQVLIECIEKTKEKYELAPDGVSFTVDRMLERPWEANYGFVPKTLQADGDGLDAYVLGKTSQGVVENCLPLCLIYTMDNGQVDNKLVCATVTAKCFSFKHKINKIVRFINKYKKGSQAVLVSWKADNIRYELAKCKALYRLFKEAV